MFAVRLQPEVQRRGASEPSGLPEWGNKVQYLVSPKLLNFSGQGTEGTERDSGNLQSLHKCLTVLM